MLGIENLSGVVALASVMLVFLTPIVIVVAVLIHKSRRTRAIHDTAIALAEKGIPIPPDLFVERRAPDTTSSLQKGIVLIAVGIGLTIFFLSMNERHAPWGVGAIPTLIGLGYLVVWWVEERKKDRKDVS